MLSPLPLRYAPLPELRAPVQSSAPCGFQRADVPHVSPAPRFSPWHLRSTAAASGRVEGGEHPPRRGDATLGDDPFLAERASQHRGNSTRVTQHRGHTAPGSPRCALVGARHSPERGKQQRVHGQSTEGKPRSKSAQKPNKAAQGQQAAAPAPHRGRGSPARSSLWGGAEM